MKILFIGKYDFSSLAGGIERYVFQLRSNLPTSCRSVNLVSNTENKTVYEESVIKVRSLGRLASTSICPSMPFILQKLLKIEKPDIIHLQFPDPMAHLAYSLCHKESKLVISWHSDILNRNVLYTLYKPFLNHILKKADSVIVHSPTLKNSKQLSVVPPNKISVIPIGVSKPIIKFSNLRKHLKGEFILFTVGRHVSYKGYDLLIKSIEYLPQDCHLYIGGIGPETSKLQQLCSSLKLTNRVHFVGYIQDQELGSYLNACDLFCFSSISQKEAFGITQIEAMLLGKPVVGFELNNGTSFVNQNGITGLIIKNKSPQAYAEAILKLRSNSELRLKLGKQAQRRAINNFSVETMVSNTLKLYNSLIKLDHLQ